MVHYPKKFKDLLRAATVEVAGSIGIDSIDKIEDLANYEDQTKDSLSMMLFMGPHLNGAFGLFCDEDFLNKTNPVKNDAKKDNIDWLSEVANRILGDLKSKSSCFSVEFENSLPLATSKNEFLEASKSIGHIEGINVFTANGSLQVCFCGAFTDKADFSGEADSSKVIGGLGDYVLF